MKRQIIVVALLAAGAFALSGCRQKSKIKTAAETVKEVVSDMTDAGTAQANTSQEGATKIILDRTGGETVWLAVGDGETGVELSKDDVRALTGYLAVAKWDAKMNESGVMVKIAAPDYTLTVTHKDVSPDVVMIWIASGRTKYRSEWFEIRPEDLAAVAALLKKY